MATTGRTVLIRVRRSPRCWLIRNEQRGLQSDIVCCPFIIAALIIALRLDVSIPLQCQVGQLHRVRFPFLKQSKGNVLKRSWKACQAYLLREPPNEERPKIAGIQFRQSSDRDRLSKEVFGSTTLAKIVFRLRLLREGPTLCVDCRALVLGFTVDTIIALTDDENTYHLMGLAQGHLFPLHIVS